MAERQIQPRERTMLIALGVVALGALAFLFLGGGEDEPITVDTPPRTPAPTVTEEPSGDGGSRPPRTSQGFDGRDPFRPLVVPASGDGGTDGGTNGGTDGGNGDTSEDRRVVLLDIFRSEGERFATVSVDGEEHTVTEGETFAGSFQLLTLSRTCGTFLFGDERFTLCIGQEVLK